MNTPLESDDIVIIDILLTAIGLSGLFIGGEMFVNAAATMARSFGISTLIVGLTVVAIGTSMPELIVSVGAALNASSDIAIGNVIGSNIANVGLIVGIAALLSPFAVHVRMVRREIPLMIGITLAVFMLILDGNVSRTDGVLLIVAAIVYILWMIFSARSEAAQDEEEETPDIRRGREALRLVIGLAILLVGARLTVDGAVAVAMTLGISELIIGITLVAIGTSLPELVTSIVAARRGESDIALGNVVGSNIANLLIILGITASIQPIPVAEHVIRFDALVMIGFALLLVPFVFNRHINRIEGAVFVTAYVGYTAFILFARDFA